MTYSERLKNSLSCLQDAGNYRTLPILNHCGTNVNVDGKWLLNLSSNDYLGLASDIDIRKEFLSGLSMDDSDFSASSSRLLTGNFTVYDELEQKLASLFNTQSALVFNSGYHANIGILPAISDAKTLILADKLVHASLIDGIRLSTAKCIRYRHNDINQIQRLLEQNSTRYEKIIMVTESVFSMDGDVADLPSLAALKKRYTNVLIYLDEAHAIGVRGKNGLGYAEETDCLEDIDFLVGTFGKALASTGAYIVCDSLTRDYLINKMRSFIFTTALPPINIKWTLFVLNRLKDFNQKRVHLNRIRNRLNQSIVECGFPAVSESHIIPLIIGESHKAMAKSKELQQNGFYALAVRPPTVPEGTSRIRLSLTANISDEEIDRLISSIKS